MNIKTKNIINVSIINKFNLLLFIIKTTHLGHYQILPLSIDYC